MRAERFEDLFFWQKARELTGLIYSYAHRGFFLKDHSQKDEKDQDKGVIHNEL
jgi:hypothetical protein